MAPAPPTSGPSGAAVLHTAASLVVVIAGLKLAAGLLVPMVFAALLALVFIRPVRLLKRLGLPEIAAILLVLLGAVGVLAGISALIGNSLGDLSRLQISLPADLQGAAAKALQSLYDSLDLPLDAQTQLQGLGLQESTRDLLGLVTQATQGILGLFSDFLLILLILVFLLLEAESFPRKLRHALGNEEADLGDFARIADQVFDYLSIKAGVSLLTGVLVALLNLLVGVELAFLLGLVAFLFNFVPNVGSFLAALPAVLLAGLQLGLGAAIVVALGYLAVNTLVGNFLEPRILGRRLGLSPLVVVLSLIFWSWVWGPAGMILSLPLTMVVRILLEHSRDGRFAAVLLGPADRT